MVFFCYIILFKLFLFICDLCDLIGLNVEVIGCILIVISWVFEYKLKMRVYLDIMMKWCSFNV